MSRVLVYSHDTYGLGNIRRMLEVAEHLVGADPTMSVLVVTGSPMIHAFRIAPGIDYIKLPCVGRDETGVAGVKTLGLDYAATMRMRANMIMMAALDFAPDLVIVDKKPLGIDDELEPMLAMLRRGPRPPHIVLLLRDILDTPERTRRQWQDGRYHEAVASFYDRILVVGEQAVFDLATQYQFPPASVAKLRYCGYIARHGALRARDQVRAEFGLDATDPLVLITAGGGADGLALMQTYLQGLRALPEPPGWSTLLVSGPELSAGERSALTELALQCPRVVCVDFTREMLSCMNAADMVVAMGGYNTVCELLTLRKPCIVVPRVAPVLEQWIRAERMQHLGLLRAIHPEVMTPQVLLDTVQQVLLQAQQGQAAPDFAMTGLQRVQQQIDDLLAAPRARAHRQAPAPAQTITSGERCAANDAHGPACSHDGWDAVALRALHLDAALAALSHGLGHRVLGGGRAMAT